MSPWCLGVSCQCLSRSRIQDPLSWFPGFRIQVDLGSRILDLGSWIPDPSPGSWVQDPGPKILDPGSLDPRSSILDPGPRIPGSWIQDPGFPGFRAFQRHQHDTRVTLEGGAFPKGEASFREWEGFNLLACKQKQSSNVQVTLFCRCFDLHLISTRRLVPMNVHFSV